MLGFSKKVFTYAEAYSLGVVELGPAANYDLAAVSALIESEHLSKFE